MMKEEMFGDLKTFDIEPKGKDRNGFNFIFWRICFAGNTRLKDF